MPGAASSHSGSASRRGADILGASPVSAAIRWARRSHSDADGRSTSVGQEVKAPMTGRSVSSSCRQSAHAEICAYTRRRSLEGRTCKAYRNTDSRRSRSWWLDSELIGPSMRR